MIVESDSFYKTSCSAFHLFRSYKLYLELSGQVILQTIFLFPLVANNALMSCIRQIVAILCIFNF